MHDVHTLTCAIVFWEQSLPDGRESPCKRDLQGGRSGVSKPMTHMGCMNMSEWELEPGWGESWWVPTPHQCRHHFVRWGPLKGLSQGKLEPGALVRLWGYNLARVPSKRGTTQSHPEERETQLRTICQQRALLQSSDPRHPRWDAECASNMTAINLRVTGHAPL